MRRGEPEEGVFRCQRREIPVLSANVSWDLFKRGHALADRRGVPIGKLLRQLLEEAIENDRGH